MSAKRAAVDDDDRFPMVIVEEEDLVWDEKLGYHRVRRSSSRFVLPTTRAGRGCRSTRRMESTRF
jgi:hypothetical protein